MPVVGFHQARRPRQSPASLLRRELSWPRPGGIAVSVIGAALIFSGAVALGPASDSSPPSAVARSSLPSTTPGPDQEQPPSSAAAHDSVTTAPSSGPAPTSTNTLPPTNATAPLIAGAGANAPIQALFAAGNGLPKNTALWDISDPDSPLVFVNKRNPLIPADYAPADLVVPSVLSGSAEPVLVRAEAAAAVELMFAAAAAQGVIITVKSSYRSFETQVSVYNGYVADKGVGAADTTSARPGFSEHQTGLAIDIGDAEAGTACDFNSCFADTAAAQWVAAHGADYGFVVRYAPGEEAVTGYLAEPWHLRYLGIAVAEDMSDHGIHSYETYLGMPAAPGY